MLEFGRYRFFLDFAAFPTRFYCGGASLHCVGCWIWGKSTLCIFGLRYVVIIVCLEIAVLYMVLNRCFHSPLLSKPGFGAQN
jgi:hypothetical protein